MAKSVVFEIQPTVFFDRSETYTYDVEPSAQLLAGWHRKVCGDKRYGIIPISEAIPFREPGTAHDDLYRRSDHVRILKVTIFFTSWRKANVRFTCFIFRHDQRLGHELSILTRPHVDVVKYFQLSGCRQPVRRLLFEVMDDIQVVKDCGETILDIAHGTCVMPTDQGPFGEVVASKGNDNYHSCGSVFDEYVNGQESGMFVRTHIVIDLDEHEYYACSSTSRSVVSQPLELFLRMDSLNTDGDKVADIDSPIIVSIEFEDLV